MNFIVQCRDLEEGMGALWFPLRNASFQTRDAASQFVSRMRATDDEESLCMYRVVEEGSDESFSQPTDALEY